MSKKLVKEWSNTEFHLNKMYWKNIGHEASLPIRKENLFDLIKVLESNNINYWLQGKTLLGIYKNKDLIATDTDDDIGVPEKYRKIIEEKIYPILQKKGFALIRFNEKFFTILRNDRFIDICFFKEKGKMIGYGGKLFPKYHFEKLEKISYMGRDISIPQDADRLLQRMYGNNIHYISNKISKKINKLNKYFVYSNYIDFYKRFIKRYAKKTTSHKDREKLNPILKTAGIKYKKISDDEYIITETVKKHIKKISGEEFLNTYIEPINSGNWKWRQPHLFIITDKGKYIKIGDIVSYLKNNNQLEKLMDKVKETDTSELFSEPISSDRRFWQTGNNYFIYSIFYQFKKNVIEYYKVNSYINNYLKNKKLPMLYSSSYYESLESMSDDEIKFFLLEKPIEIKKGAITSGKHRVCAMIGRLVEGKTYIPFWAEIK